MKATNNNTFEVVHGTAFYHFTRVKKETDSGSNQIVTLESVSSCNFIDGMRPEHTGLKVFLAKRCLERSGKLLCWGLIPAVDGSFNIKSVSSHSYLDGRDPPNHLGVRVMFTNVDKSSAEINPITSKYFQWNLVSCGNTF